MAVEARIRNLCNEKLRTVCVRTRVRVRKPPRTVKSQSRRSFIFEFVARIAGARAKRVSALNHELGNDAMKYRTAVEWNALHLASGRWVGPLFCAFGQSYRVGGANRRFIREQRARQFSSGSINDGSWLCCGRSRRPFHRRFSSRRGGLSNYLNG